LQTIRYFIHRVLLVDYFSAMIFFPNAKINLGLNVLSRRTDGYHNLESVFYPIGWTDALEIIPVNNGKGQVVFSSTGISIPGNKTNNSCVKAYEMLNNKYGLPSVKMHLHKLVPIGGGLGGGSADGVYALKALNSLFQLNISETELHGMAAMLGSDCPFFIINEPALVTGRGERIKSVQLSLKGYYLVVVFPSTHISTAEAYAGIVPQKRNVSIGEVVLTEPVEKWKTLLENDFEKSIFPVYPFIESIKSKLYNRGAVYASMTGSGAAVYGLFNKETVIDKSDYPDCIVWNEQL